MATDSLQCNHCGAILNVPPTTNFLTCNHCGTRLTVKRTSGATYTEPAGEPALQQVAEHLGEIAQQNELARMDREWQMERERYMITGRYGRRQLPNAAGSVVSGIVVVGFGILWTIFAFSITSGFPDGPGFGMARIFPLFGFLFILAGAGYSIYAFNKAQQYQRAFDAYQRRRHALLPNQRPTSQPSAPADWPASPPREESDHFQR